MSSFEQLKKNRHKISDIQYAIALLNWDQETYMPPKGQAFRAQQITTLSGIAHELSTSKDYEDLLQTLANNKSLSKNEQKNVQLLNSDFQKAKKLPHTFVERLSTATSACFHAWIKARKQNDFSLFEDELAKMIELQIEKANYYGYEGHIYNALLDDYEPKMTVQELDILFDDVKRELKDLAAKIAQAKKPNNRFMYQDFDGDKQWGFGLQILKNIGYDFAAGRQDKSEHPFTTSFSPDDVRVTTRVKEDNLYDMIWSCIHEGGHALYEQGLPSDQYGMPLGEAISLGVHESQSRYYENNLGRSKAFWTYHYPSLQQTFPDALKNIDLADFYKAVNLVQPSLIRTDADEITYHFHIMIRYEIEKQLLAGEIKAKEVKEAWNAAYKEYLNIEVPSDNQGVLQDVHWSHGGFGYFPTYSIGSFIAAQLEHQMVKDIPNYIQMQEQGDYSAILNWLREKVHQHGKAYSMQELCKEITGESLNFNYFLNYAKKKYSEIYDLK